MWKICLRKQKGQLWNYPAVERKVPIMYLLYYRENLKNYDCRNNTGNIANALLLKEHFVTWNPMRPPALTQTNK